MIRTCTANRVKISLLLVCLVFVSVLATASGAADVTVSATLSASSFSVDQSGQLSVTVNGTKDAELDVPEVKGLEILRRGQSSRVNIVNGSYSSSVTTAFALVASAPGHYTIPPITVVASGKQVETAPLELTVTKSSAAAGTAGSGGKQAPEGNEEPAVFMTLEGLDRKHYLGEVVPVTIKAYFQQGIRADLASLPSLVGDSSVIEPLQKNPLQTRETVGSIPYNVLTWKTDLSPIKEGSHSLQLEMEAVRYLQQSRQSTSMFGHQSPFGRDIFDDFFGGVIKRPLKLSSEPVPFTVHPLPAEGRPDSFNGAVGRFTFETAVEPNSAEVGEPLTLQLRIKGAGNLDRVEPPRFPDSAQWKSYTPSALDGGSAGQPGEKVFEQAIVAKKTGVRTVPPIAFSYFDPEYETYVTQTSPPLPITITGEATSPPPAPAATAAVPLAPEKTTGDWGGLAPLHLEPGKAVRSIQPLYVQTGFLAFLGTILLTLAGTAAALLYQQRSGKRDDDGTRGRQRKLRQSLQVMESAVARNDSRVFLAEARSCIQHYFGSLWGCEPSAITLGDISSKGVSSENLVALFRLSEQAAYGGCLPGKADMAASLDALRSELEAAE